MRLWIAIRMTIVLTLLTGIIYPFLVYGIAQFMFPWQANGSLVGRDRKVVGSALIGQNFAGTKYFHGRPSAAGDKGYDATSSGGSNLGPTSKTLIETVRTRVKDVIESNPGVTASQVPIDLVTASGSGLDSEISPAAAELQIPRVAKARAMSEDQVRSIVHAETRKRWAGVIGEPGVNVLLLNLALDQQNDHH
ncbi:MAG TPA: potassium-transporting ATPase subunit KdpC [Candidatus Binataceae bacterium]|nr:potassium-transporting ATPase subunit KdpC [Candidatus Binataceae bacterium]